LTYRIANLQSYILYIYSTNIGTEYFKHGIYSPFFSSSKCSLFHNFNVFGSYIIHILYTGCAKIKKIIPATKGFKELPDRSNKYSVSAFLAVTKTVRMQHDKEYPYKRNIEARSRNHCCCGKKSITYTECVFAASVTQYANRICYCAVLFSMACLASTYFPTSSHKLKNFRGVGGGLYTRVSH